MKSIDLGNERVALVDDEDYERLVVFPWGYLAHRYTAYAVYQFWLDGKKRNVFMHHQVLNVPRGFVTDHIDGDGLNNQRHNLRVASPDQNRMHQRPILRPKKTSRYKGVSWHLDRRRGRKAPGRWRARIDVSGREINLGKFDSEEEAASAYDRAAQRYFGEFAWLNFPAEQAPTSEG